MEAILPQELAKMGCCVSDINSPLEFDCSSDGRVTSSKQQPQYAPRKSKLAPRVSMANQLRNSSAELMCFTMSLSGSTIDEINDENGRGIGVNPPQLFSMPSLLDESIDNKCDKEDNFSCTNHDTATTCSDSGRSGSSFEESLALEVGHNAHEYLEECFYTEVSVLDRERFNAIPEIVKSDFTINSHLGKGSFSDVFEVVSKIGQPRSKTTSKMTLPGLNNRRRSSARDRRSGLASSINLASLSRPARQNERRPAYAMKCLRPQIRADAEQFTIGAEDLVHETAILCNLDHINIIKVHGRASGNLTDAFVLNDGYFILLDKLKETLQDRMEEWRQCPKSISRVEQANVAHSISDAVAYLHSKNIVFRDLKPANVGFDSNGVLKLFDFGFAVGLPEKDASMNPEGYLFDRCGTPRYMAPEVGLSLGYGLPSDVYSFGILLWEIHSLAKPFATIKTAAEFDQVVFVDGKRPATEDHWPSVMKNIMRSCWSDIPCRRPSMSDVKSALNPEITTVDRPKKASPKTIRSKMTKRSSVW